METPPFEVADLAEAPEAFRDDYEQKDGKYRFNLAKHVAGLKSGLSKEREEAKALRQKLTEHERELGELREKLASGGKAKPAEIERLEKLEKMVAEERTRREQAEQQVEQTAKRGEIRKAFLAAGGFEEDADDVLALVEGRFSRNEAGALVVAAEDPTITTADAFFAKEFRAKKPKFFKAPQKSGGGAAPPRGGGAASDDPNTLSGRAKIGAAFAQGGTK